MAPEPSLPPVTNTVPPSGLTATALASSARFAWPLYRAFHRVPPRGAVPWARALAGETDVRARQRTIRVTGVSDRRREAGNRGMGLTPSGTKNLTVFLARNPEPHKSHRFPSGPALTSTGCGDQPTRVGMQGPQCSLPGPNA